MKVIRPLFSSLLVLWLSGVLCGSVCGAHLRQMEAAKMPAPKAAMMPSMPAGPMSQHACCRANRTHHAAAVSDVSLDVPVDAMDCPYQRPSAEAARKFRAPESTVAAVITFTDLLPEIGSAVPVPEFKALRLPDRGSTHLHHCVFLI
jgi:hypothetical protein